MLKRTYLLLFVILIASSSFAQGTRLWKETGYEDFERGTAKGIAIGSTGKLELAPAFKVLYTSPSTFIWSIAADKDGIVYTATGAPARVYRITPDGKSTIVFEPKELQAQSVVIGKDGAIYVATSPDGNRTCVASGNNHGSSWWTRASRRTWSSSSCRRYATTPARR